MTTTTPQAKTATNSNSDLLDFATRAKRANWHHTYTLAAITATLLADHETPPTRTDLLELWHGHCDNPTPETSLAATIDIYGERAIDALESALIATNTAYATTDDDSAPTSDQQTAPDTTGALHQLLPDSSTSPEPPRKKSQSSRTPASQPTARKHRYTDTRSRSTYRDYDNTRDKQNAYYDLYERLIVALNAKPEGSKHRALCPMPGCAGKKDPALTIALRSTGTIWAKCYRCTQEDQLSIDDLCAALNITPFWADRNRDRQPPPRQQISRPLPKPKPKTYPTIQKIAAALQAPHGTPAETYLHTRAPYLADSNWLPPCARWIPIGALRWNGGGELLATPHGRAAGAIIYRYTDLTSIADPHTAPLIAVEAELLDQHGNRIPWNNHNKPLKKRSLHSTTSAIAICYHNPTRLAETEPQIILAEGICDAIGATYLATRRDGIQPALAIARAGTSGMNHLELPPLPPDAHLHIYADSGDAGRQAAINAARQATHDYNLTAEIHTSPDGTDPADIAQDHHTQRQHDDIII